MKKVLLMLLLVISTTTYSQEFEKGKELFQVNCAGCHNMEKRLVGPALQDVVEVQGREWVGKWVSNSAQLIATGDAHATEVFAEYNQMAMPAFDYLKPEELNAIVDYMEGFKKNKVAETPVATPTTDGGDEQKSEDTGGVSPFMKIFIVITLALLAVTTILVITTLRLLQSHYAKVKVTNNQLVKKLKLDTDELNAEVDFIFKKEVDKQVKEKVKSLKGDIDDRLKDFK